MTVLSCSIFLGTAIHSVQNWKELVDLGMVSFVAWKYPKSSNQIVVVTFIYHDMVSWWESEIVLVNGKVM